MKKALILFSGGKDSFLATLKYLDMGYKVYLVNYDNLCGIGSKNVLNTAKRIIKKYGTDRVELLGIRDISPIFRCMIHPFYNLGVSEIKERYGDVSISQFNCLACRTSMYVMSIIICLQNNIDVVVDGARKSQIFVIEQDVMLEEFKKLFYKYNLKIEFPLRNLSDDWDLKNEILMRGFVPKTIEPQCLLGCPIRCEDINSDIINGVVNIYKTYILDKALKCIDDYKEIKYNGDKI